MKAPKIRVGIDVGGTFTDLVMVDAQREKIFTGKLLTTPEDPRQAIMAGLKRLLEEAERPLGSLDAIVHGTTLVTNTVIERKGAKVGLITTAGFRDSLEMGGEIRYDLYDLFFEKPLPLVPRHLRIGVEERIDAKGAILLPLDEEALLGAGQKLTQEGVEAIAVSFMHAYRNPIHEEQAGRLLRAAFPDIPITLSSDVAPEIREYERCSTAVVNAYVQPLMQRYLAQLNRDLRDEGLAGSLFVMLSGGGITTVESAARAPVHLIESGPAAGGLAGAHYGRLTGLDDVIAFDMGGTTAKMCLIEGGEPFHAYQFEAGRVRRFRKGSGIPLKVPVIDLIEIGAGGGSIARLDAMGLLKVGPDSAGSEPGPVCYGLGGSEPTVTDADLLLGYLSPDYFLGGEMALDREAVERQVAAHLCQGSGLDAVSAAAGIHAVVNENMAAATRMYVAEKGRDPRRYGLIATGGAGPVHAYGLAKLLKVSTVVCPLAAGVISSLGFLVAAPATEKVTSQVMRLDGLDWQALNSLYASMEEEALTQLGATGVERASLRLQRSADMRYRGQGFEIDVGFDEASFDEGSGERLRQSFLARYGELFDRQITDVPIEALTWRLKVAAPTPHIALNFSGLEGPVSGDKVKGHRQAYFPETGFVDCPVYDRYNLRPGDAFSGPAIVEERESTLVAGPDARLKVDSHFNLIMTIGEDRPA